MGARVARMGGSQSVSPVAGSVGVGVAAVSAFTRVPSMIAMALARLYLWLDLDSQPPISRPQFARSLCTVPSVWDTWCNATFVVTRLWVLLVQCDICAWKYLHAYTPNLYSLHRLHSSLPSSPKNAVVRTGTHPTHVTFV